MIECDYKKISCNEEIFEYFSENIKYGHELDKQLSSRVNLSKGRLYSYLPATVTPEQVKECLWGGGIASSESSIDCVSSMIFDYLKYEENRICILEDSTSMPDDYFPKDLRDIVSSFNDEIYFCLTNRGLDEGKIRKAIKEAEQPNYFVAALAQLEKDKVDFCSGVPIQQDDLAILANNADKIILSAYDGEGYLIWEKIS